MRYEQARNTLFGSEFQADCTIPLSRSGRSRLLYDSSPLKQIALVWLIHLDTRDRYFAI